MKTEFGKKCECNHFESEHFPKKLTFSEPDFPYGMLEFPNPFIDKKSQRENCKKCGCKKFHAGKK